MLVGVSCSARVCFGEGSIPNYADPAAREPIGTGFVEPAVIRLVASGLRRTADAVDPNAYHNLLQVRARVLNQQLRGDFERWHMRRSRSEPVRFAA